MDGYFDGYGLGLAGAWEGPLKDADRWLRRYPPRARRRFGRWESSGALRRTVACPRGAPCDASQSRPRDTLAPAGLTSPPRRATLFGSGKVGRQPALRAAQIRRRWQRGTLRLRACSAHSAFKLRTASTPLDRGVVVV